MLHDCLFVSTSETFFLRRISSRSGDERSGRNGTKIGPRVPAWDFVLLDVGGDRDGRGARIGVDEEDVCALVLDVGIGSGYLDGAAGLGNRPESLVNGWVARGSKDESTE